MIVAEVIIRTQPGRAHAVEEHLLRTMSGFRSLQVDEGVIHGAWQAPAVQSQAIAEALCALDGDILEVDPTLVSATFD
jgi:hypothetical protein